MTICKGTEKMLDPEFYNQKNCSNYPKFFTKKYNTSILNISNALNSSVSNKN